MTRAKNNLVSGLVWHLTHRCHDQKFLLKFARDRKRWMYWMFVAKQKYNPIILNYTVTSNHIHLLVYADNRKSVYRTIQLSSGRIGWEYNKRKKRIGAFWENSYHATPVESGEHLAQCMVYIDLNMVRAGVVKHPLAWPFCGYHEIMENRERYLLINKKELLPMLNLDSFQSLREYYNGLIEAELEKNGGRDEKWTSGMAVGSDAYVKKVQDRISRHVFFAS